MKNIDKISYQLEKKLHRSLKNKELIQLLELEKSLVYFTTSLSGNERVLEKMIRMESIKQYVDDKYLLEDVIIENKQAIEMANIYSSILSGTMDAFASIISNNLNVVMKKLTSITIIISVPIMISSFWGTNFIALPFKHNPYGFMGIVSFSLILIVLITLFMRKNKFL